MNFLPVVGRELRVAARKRSTFWLRVAAAATGLVVGGACLFLSLTQGIGTSQLGSFLFYALTWICLAAVLSAGLFFTSDCLSEEKREGTLGLLFLTELRGYDVVLGKLLATSLRGFYALLAILPIMGITQLMGGITGAQYWKSSLALVNALFVSLAVGMLISALSRDSQKALAGTLLVLLLLALGGPLADAIVAGARKRGFQPVWSLISPGYVLSAASAWGRSAYWDAMGVTQLIGWTMLGLACALTPRTWQERSKAAGNARGWGYAWKHGGARRRERLRRKLLERQPIAWLTRRELWQSRALWTVAILIAGGLVIALSRHVPTGVWFIWNYAGGFFTLILYLWVASQACRFLVEAQRSGLLELLLVSPVSEREIVAGQWRGWLVMFGLPVVLLLGAHAAGAVLSQLTFQRLASQTAAMTSTVVTNTSGGGTSTTVVVSTSGPTNTAAWTATSPAPSRSELAALVVAAAASAISSAGNVLALCWVGMWMGLTSRTANLATLKTLLFVQVIPWFVIAFGTTIAAATLMTRLFAGANSARPASWLVWWPLLSAALSAVLTLAKDIGFIVWARVSLRHLFRERAARGPTQHRFAAPPPLPSVQAAPPVIAGTP